MQRTCYTCLRADFAVARCFREACAPPSAARLKRTFSLLWAITLPMRSKQGKEHDQRKKNGDIS